MMFGTIIIVTVANIITLYRPTEFFLNEYPTAHPAVIEYNKLAKASSLPEVTPLYAKYSPM
jgi:hypothetical protein